MACILNELNLLKNLKSPFIVNLHSAFQTERKLYIIMDYLRGADLRYHICYKQKFSEEETSTNFNKLRIYYGMFDFGDLIYSFKKCYPSGYKTGEFSPIGKRVCPLYWFWDIQGRKILELELKIWFKWNSWLHGPRGDGKKIIFFFGWFFCTGSHRVRAHVWGKAIYRKK